MGQRTRFTIIACGPKETSAVAYAEIPSLRVFMSGPFIIEGQFIDTHLSTNLHDWGWLLPLRFRPKQCIWLRKRVSHCKMCRMWNALLEPAACPRPNRCGDKIRHASRRRMGLFIEETSENDTSKTSARHHPDAYTLTTRQAQSLLTRMASSAFGGETMTGSSIWCSLMFVCSLKSMGTVQYGPLQTVVNVIIYARGLYGETLVNVLFFYPLI